MLAYLDDMEDPEEASYDIAQTRKREKKIRVRRIHATADVHA